MPANFSKAEGSSVAVVTQSLREAIIRGEYGPNQRLIESTICSELNASRFTVRNALQDLANEGMVVVERNRGARVRAITLDEAIEIAQARMVLEGLVASLAAERVLPYQATELEEIELLMRRAVNAGELLRYSDLNVRLHTLIHGISNHATAKRILEQLRGQMVRHQFILSLQPGRSAVSLKQHERIIATIVRRDPVEAEAAMRDHIESVIAALRSLPEKPITHSVNGFSHIA